MRVDFKGNMFMQREFYITTTGALADGFKVEPFQTNLAFYLCRKLLGNQEDSATSLFSFS
jgi:hypothetical protein